MQIPDINSETYYALRDSFMNHIDLVVNTERDRLGLTIIRPHEARECYRILYEFWSKV